MRVPGSPPGAPAGRGLSRCDRALDPCWAAGAGAAGGGPARLGGQSRVAYGPFVIVFVDRANFCIPCSPVPLVVVLFWIFISFLTGFLIQTR